MSEYTPFDQDGSAGADRRAAGPAPWSRRRTVTVAGAAAAAVLALGGGTAALAATTHASGSSSTPAAEGPGARPGPGGPAGGPHTPHLDGTVTAVTSSSITIKDHDGFTRTIVVSSSTKYSGGLSAEPTVGTAIHAQGKVDANGTSLDATTVTKDTGPADGGPGHGRGPGRGPAGGPPAGVTPPNPGSKPSSGSTPPSTGATPPSTGVTPPASSSAAPSASASGS